MLLVFSTPAPQNSAAKAGTLAVPAAAETGTHSSSALATVFSFASLRHAPGRPDYAEQVCKV